MNECFQKRGVNMLPKKPVIIFAFKSKEHNKICEYSKYSSNFAPGMG